MLNLPVGNTGIGDNGGPVTVRITDLNGVSGGEGGSASEVLPGPCVQIDLIDQAILTQPDHEHTGCCIVEQRTVNSATCGCGRAVSTVDTVGQTECAPVGGCPSGTCNTLTECHVVSGCLNGCIRSLSNVVSVLQNGLNTCTECATQLDEVGCAVVSSISGCDQVGGIQIVVVLVLLSELSLSGVDLRRELPASIGCNCRIQDRDAVGGLVLIGDHILQLRVELVHVGEVVVCIGGNRCIRLTLHPHECNDLGIKTLVGEGLETVQNTVLEYGISSTLGGTVVEPVGSVSVGLVRGQHRATDCALDEVEGLAGIGLGEVLSQTDLDTEAVCVSTLSGLNVYELPVGVVAGRGVVVPVHDLHVGESGIVSRSVGRLMQTEVGNRSRTGGVRLTCKQDDVCLLVADLSVLAGVNGSCHSSSSLQVGNSGTGMTIFVSSTRGRNLRAICIGGKTGNNAAQAGVLLSCLGLTGCGGPDEEVLAVGDRVATCGGQIHDHGSVTATGSHVLLGLLIHHNALDGSCLRVVPTVNTQGDVGTVSYTGEHGGEVGDDDVCGHGETDTNTGCLVRGQRLSVRRARRLSAPQLEEALSLGVLHGLLCLGNHVSNSVVLNGIQSVSGTTVVDVVQTTQRSHVTVGVEGLHGGHVGILSVNDLELKIHGVVVRDAQLSQRHSDHHLVVLDLVGNGVCHSLELVCVVGTGVLSNGGGELTLCCIVDDVIVTVPTGVSVTVDIYVELHPSVVGVIRNCLSGLDVEVNVLGIRGDLGCHDIVTTGVVGVDLERLGTITDVVTVGSIAHRIGVGQSDVVPLVEGTGHVDGITLVLNDVGSGTLCLLDIGDQLHIVVVEVVALRHLHITGELNGCGVNELSLGRSIGCITCGVTRLTVVVGSNPLVPARDQDVLDVGLSKSVVELLLEVVTVVGAVLVVAPVGPLSLCVGVELRVQSRVSNVVTRRAVGLEGTSAVVVVSVTVLGGRIREFTGSTVLCKGDVDRALVAVRVGVHSLRPVEVHPRPRVVGLSHVAGQNVVQRVVRPLGLLHGEEFANLGSASNGLGSRLIQHVGSCNHNRLAVNAEPSVGIHVLAVNVVVDLSDTLDAIRVGVEHDLRNIIALIAVLLKDAHESQRSVGVREVVGDIEIQEVNACIHQKLYVLAVNVGIVTVIVAVQRLCEPVHVTRSTDRAVGVATVGLQGCLQVVSLTDRVVAAEIVQTVPQEVEHTDVLLLIGRNGTYTILACLREGATQIVHTTETTEEVVVVVGNDVGLGLLSGGIVVADGNGLTVSGGSVGQRTLSGIQSRCVVVYVLGAVVPCVVCSTHDLQLTDSGEVHANAARSVTVVIDVNTNMSCSSELGRNVDLRVVSVAAGYVHCVLEGLTAVVGNLQDPTEGQRTPVVRGRGGLQTDGLNGINTLKIDRHVNGILLGDLVIIDIGSCLEVQTAILDTIDQTRRIPVAIVDIATFRHGDGLVQRNVALCNHILSLVAGQCICRESHDRTCEGQNEQHAQSHSKECEKSLFHCEKLLSNLGKLKTWGN